MGANENRGSGAGRLFATGERYRVHRSYIWLAPLGAAMAILVTLLLSSFGVLVDTFSELDMTAAGSHPFVFAAVAFGLVFAVVYGIMVACYAWSYRHMWFQFDEAEFSFYSGIINKHRAHIPYTRVQSVNHQAGIVQRIFGLCTVTLDTAGGASNKEVRIPYLKLDYAERLRVELFARKAGLSVDDAAYTATMAAPEGGDSSVAPSREGTAVGIEAASLSGAAPASAAPSNSPNVLDDAAAPVIGFRGAFGGFQVEQQEARFETGLSTKELLLASATHSGAIGMLVAFGIVALLMVVLLSVVGLLLVPVLVAVVAIAWLIGAAVAFFGFGGFKVRRRGSRIEVERGLLQRQFSGIDIERVQSVVVRQSFVRRCLGYCEVSLGRIDTLPDSDSNGSNDSVGRLVVHPFIKVDEVDALLNNLLPEFADWPRRTQLTPLPRVALRRAIIRRAICYNPALYCTMALAVLQWFCSLFVYQAIADDLGSSTALAAMLSLSVAFFIGYALCVVATVACVVGTVFWQRESGFGMNRRFACFYNGGLSTEYVVVPRVKVQFGLAHTNPLQRRAHTATISMTTAAGLATGTVLVDVDEQDACAWLLWVEPHGNR